MATVTWQGDESAYYSVGGNWDTGSVPAAGDDVVINNAVNIIVNTMTANLKSWDMTGYTGQMSGTSTIKVTGAASATSVVKLDGTTSGFVGSFQINPAAADTIIQVTFNGKSLTSLNIGVGGNSSANVYFLDAINLSSSLTLTNGILHVDGLTDNAGLSHSISRFTTSSGTKTLNLGNSTVTCTRASGAAWTWSTTNATLTEGTSTIICNGNSATFSGGGETYSTVTFNTGTGTRTIAGNNSFGTLNFTGSAEKNSILSLSGNNTVTGVLNIDGNSLINRAMLVSSVLDTPRTLTISGATISGCSNVNFENITFANGGSNVDFSSITGGSGDCGGNSISGGGTLSFTTADDWYWQTTGTGTYNFSDYNYWFTATNGGGSQMASTRCPLPQDNCYFDADSISGSTTVDQDLYYPCKDLDFTGCDSLSVHFNNNSQIFTGSLILSSSLSLTTGGGTGFYFRGRGTHTLTLAGKSFGYSGAYIQSVGGTYSLGSDFLSTNYFGHENGTFSAGVYNVTCRQFVCDSGYTRALNLGSGTWTLNPFTTSYCWAITSTGLTFDKETANIAINILDAYDIDFRGGNYTYNDITIDSGANTVIIEESNTFATFTITAGSKVQFTDGTDTTVSSFVAEGDAVDGITINGTSTAGFKLSDSSGTNTVHYCTIDYCTCEGGALWIATDNCVDGGHNSAPGGDGSTGWLFIAGGEATIDAKARIKQISAVKSVTSKGRVKKPNISVTAQTKARIKQGGIVKTVQAKGRVKKEEMSVTIQAKGRINISGNIETVQAKGQIKISGNSQSEQVKARIKKEDIAESIQSKARITNAGQQKTVQAKANIFVPVAGAKTIQSKSRILIQGVVWSEVWSVYIAESFSKTVQAKSRIKQVGQVKTVQAKSRVKQISQIKTIQAKAKVVNSYDKEIEAKSRIKIFDNERTIQAKGKIEKPGVYSTIEAKGRISIIGISNTVQAKSRIFSSGNLRIISAKAKIRIEAATATIQARANIWSFHSGYVKMKREDQSNPLVMESKDDFQKLRSVDQKGIISLTDNRIF